MSKSKGSPALREDNIQRARALWLGRQDLKRMTRERSTLERSRRSAAEQLAMLDYRLGYGVGAKRERKRLSRG